MPPVLPILLTVKVKTCSDSCFTITQKVAGVYREVSFSDFVADTFLFPQCLRSYIIGFTV